MTREKDKIVDTQEASFAGANCITKYAEYISNIVNINKTVEKLIDIKDSLMIFHKNKNIKDIQKITEVIDEIAFIALWIPWTYRN